MGGRHDWWPQGWAGVGSRVGVMWEPLLHPNLLVQACCQRGLTPLTQAGSPARSPGGREPEVGVALHLGHQGQQGAGGQHR